MVVSLTYIKHLPGEVSLVVDASLTDGSVRVLIKMNKDTAFSGSLDDLKKIVSDEDKITGDKLTKPLANEVYDDLLTINEKFEELLSKRAL